MTREEELKETMLAAREELNTIKDAERIIENSKYAGKKFTFMNNYSMPETEEDYWTVYYSIDGLDEYGNMVCWSFQTDTDGKVTVEKEKYMNTSLLKTEISDADFYAAFELLIENLNTLR